MLKENEYRRHAAQTVALAHRAATTEDKGRLLALADAWLDLADRAQRVAVRRAWNVLDASQSAGGNQDVQSK